jgi:serine protease Do
MQPNSTITSGPANSPSARWRWGLYLAVLGVALAFAGGYYFRDQQQISAGPLFTKSVWADGATLPPGGFAEVVKKATPAVVTISTKMELKQPANMRRRGNGTPFEMFEDFFGQGPNNMPQIPRRRPEGLGSGIVMSADGYIITNNHVIDGASSVKVIFKDKRELEAKVIGGDKLTDVAVLKVEASGLPILPVGNSDKVEIGDLALAIGNPFGVGQTVTMGIVSATGRRGISPGDGPSIEDFIQTDAAINRGNSGGALINSRGELIGINSAIYTPSGANAGIGFAIPVNLARDVMSQLVKGGKVQRGYLGIGLQPLTEGLAKANDLPTVAGALVRSVEADGPAKKAGLEQGDVILSVNGDKIEDSDDLIQRVARQSPGTVVKLGIRRDGKDLTMPVTLATRPARIDRSPSDADEDDEPETGRPSKEPSVLSGVSVEALSPQLARQYRIGDDVEGVLITDIEQDSPAVDAGLQPGDVIQQVKNQKVTTISEFNRAISALNGKTVMLFVYNPRSKQSRYVGIMPKK